MAFFMFAIKANSKLTVIGGIYLEIRKEFIEKSLGAATMSPINFYRAVEQRRELKTISNHFDCTDLDLLEDVLREK
jgi:hypothetical protein